MGFAGQAMALRRTCEMDSRPRHVVVVEDALEGAAVGDVAEQQVLLRRELHA